MARYRVDKSSYEKLLIGTTITSCSIGSEEIMLDTDSDKDLILIIDKIGSFWRIRNNATIIESAYTVNFSIITEQSEDDDEMDSYAQLETCLEEAYKAINDSIIGKKIVEVKVTDFELTIKFDDGLLFEAFKSLNLEDGTPSISLFTGIKDLKSQEANMCAKIKLVTPTPEIVEKYNKFREKTNTEWEISLFNDCTPVDIRDYIVLKNEDGTYESPYEKYSKDDEIINEHYKNAEISDFFKELNSVYHTRLDTSKLSNLTKDWLNEHNVDDLVKYCKKNTGKYAYSFATKVYSFVDPEKNPIMDSYVSTLLWEYVDVDYKKNHTKSDWGSYDEYKKAYLMFRKTNRLEDYSFKQLDIFLWTYSVAIQNYWIQQGGLSFSSVPYKTPKTE